MAHQRYYGPPPLLMGLLRLRQGLRSLTARYRRVDLDRAADLLAPDLLALFSRLSRGEQIHSLNVLATLYEHSHRDGLSVPDDLAQAALLHDVGKSRCRLNTLEKTLGVAVRSIAPGSARRWGQSRDLSHWWRRIFMVAWQHPSWSAELVRDQVSERALWLIAHHAEPAASWAGHPYSELLARLQAADDWN